MLDRLTFTTPYVVENEAMSYPALTPTNARMLAQNLVNAGQHVVIFEWNKKEKQYQESSLNEKVTANPINLKAVVALKHLEVVAKEQHDTVRKGGSPEGLVLQRAVLEAFEALGMQFEYVNVTGQVPVEQE